MDTKVNYLGLELPHPFIAGASPLADTLDGVRRVEDGGASAVVLRSLFEEQITAESVATYMSTESHANSFAEASSHFVDPVGFKVGPELYLENLRRVKEAVKIPVIGSLNGHTLGGWLSYAKAMQEMGADAIELNVFQVATEEEDSAEQIEKMTLEMVRELKSALRIPFSVKLSPFYTALPHFARRLEEAGASGFVLFNRFFESDIDVDDLNVISQMHLSTSDELLLRLRWLAILSGRLRNATLAVSGGVHTGIDAVKAIMCGASAVQLVAAILKRGPAYIRTIRQEVTDWLTAKEYESLEQMRGSMNILRSPNPREFARANYMKMLLTWTPE